MWKRCAGLLGLTAMLLSSWCGAWGGQALAGEARLACMLVVDAGSGKVLAKEGEACAQRNSPASTFKVALALMGFEAGILQDSHHPLWPYRKEYNASLEIWRHDTDPARWEDKSVAWFSQRLTRKLGMARFQKFVDAFGYGNRDLSGDPGKNNGLTHAWLASSLAISPEEQVAFLRRMLNGQLPVSARTVEKTMAVLPTHRLANGWTVHGKTGSAFEHDARGRQDRMHQFGWYVGVAEKDGRRIVFARLNRDGPTRDGAWGVPTRNEVWSELETVLKG